MIGIIIGVVSCLIVSVVVDFAVWGLGIGIIV